MLWDEPKIFFLERRYFFSIILSEFLKNRVALHRDRFTAAHVVSNALEKDTWHTGPAGFSDISSDACLDHFIALVYKAAFFALFEHQVRHIQFCQTATLNPGDCNRRKNRLTGRESRHGFLLLLVEDTHNLLPISTASDARAVITPTDNTMYSAPSAREQPRTIIAIQFSTGAAYYEGSCFTVRTSGIIFCWLNRTNNCGFIVAFMFCG